MIISLNIEIVSLSPMNKDCATIKCPTLSSEIFSIFEILETFLKFNPWPALQTILFFAQYSADSWILFNSFLYESFANNNEYFPVCNSTASAPTSIAASIWLISGSTNKETLIPLCLIFFI